MNVQNVALEVISMADRHPPTGLSRAEDGALVQGKEGVRLLTWGDPYLEAWLLALRGDSLTEGDYAAVGLMADENSMER